MTLEFYKPRQAESVVALMNWTPDWFLDVGVGTGAEALVFSKRFPKCKIIGFEPSSAARRFWDDKHFPGLLLPYALTWTNSRMPLFAASRVLHGTLLSPGEFALIAPHEKARIENDFRPTEEVETRTIDSLDVEHGPFDNAFLWMDCELAEHSVLVGAAQALARRAIRGINLEMHAAKVAGIHHWLADLGFQKVLEYENETTHWDEVWFLT